MKLIIQIPCFNEAETLATTFQDLPTHIAGVAIIEVVVIDDGSTDATAEVGKRLGATHVVRLKAHRGLAQAFAEGLDASLRLGADIIVNTDADNQYSGQDIAKLVQPILDGSADIVIGSRNIESIEHFSPIKKVLQRIGSFFVRTMSETAVPDATSGFRAYNREAALRTNVFSDFTYTIETIIQAGASGLTVTHVPITTNPKLRESRLFGSVPEYVLRSVATIVRIYTMYKPLRVFTVIGSTLFSCGILLIFRFLYFYVARGHEPTGHVQSLIIASVLMIIGFQILMFGLLADLTAKNRRIVEDILIRTKRIEFHGRD